MDLLDSSFLSLKATAGVAAAAEPAAEAARRQPQSSRERPGRPSSSGPARPACSSEQLPPGGLQDQNPGADSHAQSPVVSEMHRPDHERCDAMANRLLEAVPAAWEVIGDRVVAARERGIRVVAIAGGSPGEGRTTLVLGLGRVLRERGHAVQITDQVPTTLPDAGLVIVDAGIWFPPGPVRPARVSLAAVGCDAAMLVRREEEPACPARGRAIQAAGLELLGEVVTFANDREGTPKPAPEEHDTHNLPQPNVSVGASPPN
jgi:hypothetical protein